MSRSVVGGWSDQETMRKLSPIALVLIALGAMAVGGPVMLLIPIAALGSLFLLTTSLGRLLMLCFGVLVMFGSSVFSAPVRSLFTIMLFVGLPLAGHSILQRARSTRINLRGYLIPIFFLFSVPFLSLFAAALYATDLVMWIRDGTTFILIPVSVVYALDAGLSVRSITLQRIFTLVGLVGGLGYLLTWLAFRGQVQIPGGVPLLSSSMLVVPVISMCLALYFTSSSRRRYMWAAIAAILVLLLVGAGGRSALLYLGATLLVAVAVATRARRGLLRLAILLVVAAIVLSGFYRIYASFVGPQFLSGRFDWFTEASWEAITDDASGQDRVRAYSIMWNSFLEKPLLGNGFGYNYPSVSATGIELFTLDSPLVYLAKFGLIGAAVVLLSLAGIVDATIKQSKHSPHRLRIVLMNASAVAAWVAILPSGAPTEQKGFGVGLALLVALSIAWNRESSCQPIVRREAGRRIEVRGRSHRVTRRPDRAQTDCPETTDNCTPASQPEPREVRAQHA
ncbi:O-antigen ligase family protein [Kocuria rosea]|nr:O-antigen ligase family protein [Kocuria rosea]